MQDQRINQLTRERDDLAAALDKARMLVMMALAHEHYPKCNCSKTLVNHCDERRLREVLSLRKKSQDCTRNEGHEGPCNGFPRPTCVVLAAAPEAKP